MRQFIKYKEPTKEHELYVVTYKDENGKEYKAHMDKLGFIVAQLEDKISKLCLGKEVEELIDDYGDAKVNDSRDCYV